MRIGVVSTAGRDHRSGRRSRDGRRCAESYLVGDDGRVAWFEEGTERAERVAGHGTMLVVADGEGDDDPSAGTAAASVCRVLGKLWKSGADAPGTALPAFVAAAHTRMYWKSRERGTHLSASCAVAWILGDRLHFVEIGSARVLLWRGGRLVRVGLSSPGSDGQRMLAGSVGLGDDSAVHLVAGRNAGTVALHAGDQVLVVTDGLHRALDEASTAQVLQHVDDAQVAVVTLLDRALARGADDGITVAIADLRDVVATASRQVRSDEPPVRVRNLITEP